MQKIKRGTSAGSFLVLLCGIALLAPFAGCTKQVPGPKGDPGQAGGQGNLKLTQVSTVVSAWTPGSNGWEFVLNVPEITGDVMTVGEVAVYRQVGNRWWKLPYSVGNLFTQAFIRQGEIHFKYSMIHDGPPEKPDPIPFRIVISRPAN